MATSPPGSAATSTQAPLELLAVALRQVPGTWSAGVPFATFVPSP
jgi:hypothetical protein